MNYKDILIRALKTFIQAFIPVVAAAFAAADITDFSNLKTVGYSALISGAAAGISAVWNFIIQFNNRPTEATSSIYVEDLGEYEIDDMEDFDEEEANG